MFFQYERGQEMQKSKGLLVIVEVMGVVHRTYSDWMVASRWERIRDPCSWFKVWLRNTCLCLFKNNKTIPFADCEVFRDGRYGRSVLVSADVNRFVIYW